MSAYRYNGVCLPQLPAWDTGTYPYAAIQYISYRSGGFISHLRYSDQPFYDRNGFFSYNGAQLPAPPEYDRTAYPYGLITEAFGLFGYYAYPLRPYADGGSMRVRRACLPLFWIFGNGKWEASDCPAVTEDDVQPLPRWSDFNVLRQDGSAASAAARPVAVSGITSAPGAAVFVHTCRSEQSDFTWGTAYRLTDPVLSLAPDTVIWSNTDLTDGSGALVLAASNPVPVQTVSLPDFCLNSWLAGLVTGMVGSAPGPRNGADPAGGDPAALSGAAFTLSPAWMLHGWVAGRKLARMLQPQ